MSNIKSVDECPVRGCGQWVPGVDAQELFDGSEYECRAGHALHVVFYGNLDDPASLEAHMEPFREPSGRIQRFARG